jgi:hypothetical protein
MCEKTCLVEKWKKARALSRSSHVTSLTTELKKENMIKIINYKKNPVDIKLDLPSD